MDGTKGARRSWPRGRVLLIVGLTVLGVGVGLWAWGRGMVAGTPPGTMPPGLASRLNLWGWVGILLGVGLSLRGVMVVLAASLPPPLGRKGLEGKAARRATRRTRAVGGATLAAGLASLWFAAMPLYQSEGLMALLGVIVVTIPFGALGLLLVSMGAPAAFSPGAARREGSGPE